MVKFGARLCKIWKGAESGGWRRRRGCRSPVPAPGGRDFVSADQHGVTQLAPPYLCGPGMGADTMVAERAVTAAAIVPERDPRVARPAGMGEWTFAIASRSRRCAHPIASAVGGV